MTATPKETKHEKEAYEVSSESNATKDVFKIARAATGVVTRTCEPKGKGGCPESGEW